MRYLRENHVVSQRHLSTEHQISDIGAPNIRYTYPLKPTTHLYLIFNNKKKSPSVYLIKERDMTKNELDRVAKIGSNRIHRADPRKRTGQDQNHRHSLVLMSYWNIIVKKRRTIDSFEIVDIYFDQQMSMCKLQESNHTVRQNT